MGIFASKYLNAWCRAQQGRANDRDAAQQGIRSIVRRIACIISAFSIFATPVQPDTLRIATFAAPLSRDGPGLLLRDIDRGNDPQILAVRDIVRHIGPDILVLTDFDYDLDNFALTAFAALFGAAYPFQFSLQPNAGVASGLDLDGNGRLGDARDAYGYGRFAGDGGMAILSRYPVDIFGTVDLSTVLWRDLPGANLPKTVNGPFPSAAAQEVMRLSSTGHWIVPIKLADGHVLSLLAFSATPPVFDGEEDINGLRNRDELRMWQIVLDGGFGPAPDSFVFAGNTNLDPDDGQGFSDVMARFLDHPQLIDPLPGKDTADWPEAGPGDLRVSYVLPSKDWSVADAGVFWPTPEDPLRTLVGDDGLAAGPHHLVWVDISR